MHHLVGGNDPVLTVVPLLPKSDILLPFLGLALVFPLCNKTDYMLRNLWIVFQFESSLCLLSNNNLFTIFIRMQRNCRIPEKVLYRNR
jgi:hypothetical protein